MDEARRYLKNVRREARAIPSYKARYEEALYKMTLQAVVFDRGPGGSEISRKPESFALIVDRFADELNRVTTLQMKALDIIDRIEDPDTRILLSMRYVEGDEWNVVAKALHKSESHVRGPMHGRALVLFRAVYDDNT